MIKETQSDTYPGINSYDSTREISDPRSRCSSGTVIINGKIWGSFSVITRGAKTQKNFCACVTFVHHIWTHFIWRITTESLDIF